jgi:DNA-binding GntR family transcriptional regulator
MEFGILKTQIELNPHFVDQVYDRLLEAISLGELRPGQRVRQGALAERLGVSRQPISHALQMLKQQGLVRDAPTQGLEVAPLDPDYVLHLYEARTSLESTAAALAAARVAAGVAAPADRQLLEAKLEAGLAAISGHRPLIELVKADADFHGALYRLSGNPVIEQMMAAQWPHLMRSMLGVLNDPGVPERAWEEHGAIAGAVLAGEAERARTIAAAHMARAGSDLHRRLKSSLLLNR